MSDLYKIAARVSELMQEGHSREEATKIAMEFMDADGIDDAGAPPSSLQEDTPGRFHLPTVMGGSAKDRKQWWEVVPQKVVDAQFARNKDRTDAAEALEKDKKRPLRFTYIASSGRNSKKSCAHEDSRSMSALKFARSLAEKNGVHEHKWFDLWDMNIEPCNGCYGCFVDPDVRVLSGRGWKPISKAKKGTKLLSHGGKFQRVVGERKDLPNNIYSGELVAVTYTIEDVTYRVRVTPDHRFKESSDAWVRAENLLPNHKLKWVGKRCEVCDKPFSLDDGHTYDGVCGKECANRSGTPATNRNLLEGQFEQFDCGVVSVEREQVTNVELLCPSVETDHSFLIDGGLVSHNSEDYWCHWPCLPASERVTTERGLHGITEIEPGDYLPTGVVAKQWQTSPEEDVFLLKLSDGRELRLTANHPVKVRCLVRRMSWGREWTTDWIQASKLKKGDSVPFPLGGGFARNPDSRPDIGLLAGLVWGDGTWSHNNPWLYVHESELSLLKSIKNQVPEWIAVRDHSEPGMKVVAWSTATGRYLKSRGFDKGGLPKDRRLPLWLMRDATEDEVCAFLRGLFTTDGSINRKTGSKRYRISLSNASYHALRDVQLLLQKLGVFSRVDFVKGTTKIRRSETARAHNLEIARWDSQVVFAKKIGFSLARKQALLDDCCASPPRKTSCPDPVGKVVSLEFVGREPVYDITVEGSHEFVAEGVPVHNCSCWPLDDMIDLYEAFVTSDAIIFATPVNEGNAASRLYEMWHRCLCMDGGLDFRPPPGWQKSEEALAAMRKEFGEHDGIPIVQRFLGKPFGVMALGHEIGAETAALSMMSGIYYRGGYVPAFGKLTKVYAGSGPNARDRDIMATNNTFTEELMHDITAMVESLVVEAKHNRSKPKVVWKQDRT